MPGSEKQRIDKWLFFTRALKSRSLAAKLASDGKVKINGTKTASAAQSLRAGDRIQFDNGDVEKIYLVKGLGTRRGPAPEAANLYEDVTPPPPPKDLGLVAVHGGRPEKSDRRAYERLRAQIFDRD